MTLRRVCFAVLLAFISVWAASTGAPTIHEYDVPTPKSHPHDPAYAPDGSLWYTGQMVNKLGRLDPKTGKFTEYPLKTPESGPHGLVVDKDGYVWFTAQRKGYIGRLDPKTGEVREYPTPQVDDPHTPVLDANGTIWFTAEDANRVGRLHTQTGKVQTIEAPTKRAVPYGIVVTQKGIPIFCEFGTNKLGSVDPQTMKIREYTLPQGARPRRLAVAPDGSIYYSDFARGFLGHLDPATGKVEEWASPGGANSEPYGIAVTNDGVVWYSESGVQPNTLVRFDPTTKKFGATPIPSGGGVVRNMVATPDGKHLYLACSGVNKVAVVEVQ